MPTYDYVCDACGEATAVFQGIKEDPLTTCPACGEERLRRKIGAGAGIIFKGSGFYETDYKRNRTSSGKDKSGGAGDKEGSSGKKGDSGSSSSGGDSGGKPAKGD